MLLGLLRPDAGTVSLVRHDPPQDAIAGGLVGAMLQAGALIRDLSVRELLAMMASLYPDPLDVDEVIELTGLSEIADRRTHKLSGGQAQRLRFALALVAIPALLVLDEPTVALDVEAPPRLLGDDARLRRPRQDRGLRDALPRGGRRLRRPRRPDGARPGGRRRADDRDQGTGGPRTIRATLPGVGPGRALARCPA